MKFQSIFWRLHKAGFVLMGLFMVETQFLNPSPGAIPFSVNPCLYILAFLMAFAEVHVVFLFIQWISTGKWSWNVRRGENPPRPGGA